MFDIARKLAGGAKCAV